MRRPGQLRMGPRRPSQGPRASLLNQCQRRQIRRSPSSTSTMRWMRQQLRPQAQQCPRLCPVIRRSHSSTSTMRRRSPSLRLPRGPLHPSRKRQRKLQRGQHPRWRRRPRRSRRRRRRRRSPQRCQRQRQRSRVGTSTMKTRLPRTERWWGGQPTVRPSTPTTAITLASSTTRSFARRSHQLGSARTRRRRWGCWPSTTRTRAA
mmetsp:Transcript_35230/g.84175  ORF Transcript_35230/g.84175 Transcript_35230/m.84175 type:complete len:204 (+) Transcript_35230:1362-1973(+)